MPGACRPAGRNSTWRPASSFLATGFRPYQPRLGEYGYRELPEVITLPELIRQLAEAPAGDTLCSTAVPSGSAALIHCVAAARFPASTRSRKAATSTNTAPGPVAARRFMPPTRSGTHYPQTRVFDFYRDIRTYGRGQEELYTQAAQNRVLFFRFEAGEEPQVLRNPDPQGPPLLVRVKGCPDLWRGIGGAGGPGGAGGGPGAQ